MLPASGEALHTKKQRKQAYTAIWHSFFSAKELAPQSGKGTQLEQKKTFLSAEAIKDTESWAQDWERPLKIHAFPLQLLHQVVISASA